MLGLLEESSKVDAATARGPEPGVTGKAAGETSRGLSQQGPVVKARARGLGSSGTSEQPVCWSEAGLTGSLAAVWGKDHNEGPGGASWLSRNHRTVSMRDDTAPRGGHMVLRDLEDWVTGQGWSERITGIKQSRLQAGPPALRWGRAGQMPT